MEVYLDNSATTRPSTQVLAEMNRVFQDLYGNPSSLHGKGLEAERALKQARRQIAAAVAAGENEIIFTSGGTEANNLALLGAAPSLRRFGNVVITTAIEHPAVKNVFTVLAQEGFEVKTLGVTGDGLIRLEELEEYLKLDPVLVSVMMVNNETGSIQPIAAIGRLLARLPRKPVFHVDAVQALGKIPVDVNECRVDLLSLSGHKINGPKGVGALYIRKGVRLRPLMYGGGQEAALRPGTENLPGIVGMAAASVEATQILPENSAKIQHLKARLAAGILENIPQTRLNGLLEDSFAPHILNISFYGIRGEVLVHALEQDGIYVSTGSACSSRKKTYSHVLTAMGLDKAALEGAIRFSFCAQNTETEIDYVLERLGFRLNQLRQIGS